MARYLLAYHGGGMAETEEEQANVMAAWTAWFEGLGGAIVDPGYPVMRAMTIAADGSQSDGGGANPVTGYSVINAEHMDAAVAMAKGCPHLQSAGNIEVSETFEVNP